MAATAYNLDVLARTAAPAWAGDHRLPHQRIERHGSDPLHAPFSNSLDRF